MKLNTAHKDQVPLRLTAVQIYLLLLITLFVCSILWSYRWIFTYRYNYAEAADRINQSQWRIPQSTRLISDDQLYPYSGYEIMTGKKFILLNAEVPPFAKSLYGLAIITTQNPYFASLILFTVSLICFYILAKTSGLKTTYSLIAVLILLLNQLFFAQLGQTMLDLTQMLLLIFNLIFLLRATNHPTKLRLGMLILSGIALGLFAASKFPIFALVILLVELVWLAWHYRTFKLLILVASMLIAYGASYAILLFGDSTASELLRVQTWMIHFYAIGKTEPSPIQTVLQLVSGDWILRTKASSILKFANEWNIWWTVSIASFIFFLFSKKTSAELRLQAVIGTAICCALIAAPFVNRYFLLILPIGIILSVSLIANIKRIFIRNSVFVSLILIGSIQSIFFIGSEPFSKLVFTSESWQNGNYQDVYSYLSNKTTISKSDFVQSLKITDLNHYITDRSLTISEPTVQQLFQPSYTVHGSSMILLANGESNISTFPIVAINQNGQLKLKWSDEFLGIPSDQQCLTVPIDTGSSINYLTISKSQPDLESLIKTLTPLTGKSGIELRNVIVIKHDGLQSARLYLPDNLDNELIKSLMQIPGVELTQVSNQEVHNSLCKP